MTENWAIGPNNTYFAPNVYFSVKNEIILRSDLQWPNFRSFWCVCREICSAFRPNKKMPEFKPRESNVFEQILECFLRFSHSRYALVTVVIQRFDEIQTYVAPFCSAFVMKSMNYKNLAEIVIERYLVQKQDHTLKCLAAQNQWIQMHKGTTSQKCINTRIVLIFVRLIAKCSGNLRVHRHQNERKLVYPEPKQSNNIQGSAAVLGNNMFIFWSQAHNVPNSRLFWCVRPNTLINTSLDYSKSQLYVYVAVPNRIRSSVDFYLQIIDTKTVFKCKTITKNVQFCFSFN